MEQDKELFQWIMQYNPLDETYPPQSSLPTVQRSSLSHQTDKTTPQELFLSASANVLDESSSSSHPQYLNGERQQHHQQGPVVDALPQYLNQPARLYTTIDEFHLPTFQSQSQPYHIPPATDLPHQPNDKSHLSEEDECLDSNAQLKMMSSKERRQVRNKISARNFRNRRKEYIASLEEEATKFKNENSQLRLEINWVRSTMNKLQTENDQLRVKLAFCHSGIKVDHNIPVINADSSPSPTDQPSPPEMITASSIGIQQERSPPSAQQQHRHILPTTATTSGITDSPSGPSPSSSSPFTKHPSPVEFTQSAHSSNLITPHHPPPDLQRPAGTYRGLLQLGDNSQPDFSRHSPSNQAPFYQPSISAGQQHYDSNEPSFPHQNNNDSYVETALFPDFDFGDILSKQQKEPPGSLIIQDYPLLAVALISIVIGQAMAMVSTGPSAHLHSLSAKVEDLVEQDPPSLRDLPSNKPQTQVESKSEEAIANEMGNRQPAASTEDPKAIGSVKTLKPVHSDDPWYNVPANGIQAICPLYWMQRMLCKFVVTYLVVKYPHLEAPCKTYLPICEQFRRRVTHT